EGQKNRCVSLCFTSSLCYSTDYTKCCYTKVCQRRSDSLLGKKTRRIYWRRSAYLGTSQLYLDQIHVLGVQESLLLGEIRVSGDKGGTCFEMCGPRDLTPTQSESRASSPCTRAARQGLHTM
ncbi:hypothetical protein OESDEN_08241, partial [Oesophagostomum dentatum]